MVLLPRDGALNKHGQQGALNKQVTGRDWGIKGEICLEARDAKLWARLQTEGKQSRPMCGAGRFAGRRCSGAGDKPVFQPDRRESPAATCPPSGFDPQGNGLRPDRRPRGVFRSTALTW